MGARFLEPFELQIQESYSSLPNNRTGPNKRTGWNFDKNQISVQGGILIKILDYRAKTGYFIDNKKKIPD